MQNEYSDAELYWIIKHGIKMTGMPAFGLTHSDEDLWAIVAFLRELPQVKAQEYEAMVEAAGIQNGAGGHDHQHGTAHGHHAVTGTEQQEHSARDHQARSEAEAKSSSAHQHEHGS